MPVYLWQLGLSLAGLCLLLGISGLAFSAALVTWQRLARTRALTRLVGLTFVLELVLITCVALAGPLLGADTPTPQGQGIRSGEPSRALGSASTIQAATLVALLVGAANGAYNAFYWTTQRALFAGLGTERDSGRRYGNLQIIVAGFLKVGILLGGFLLDTGGLHWILLLSAAVGLLGARALAADAGCLPLQDEPHLSVRRALAYRDAHGSARVFTIDGLFLYLESHFWTLSLFLLVREDHSRLGVVVVVLGIVFALLFLLIKNRIDRPGAADAVYRASVALYALSWLLRLAVDEAAAASVTLALLVGVTFCSSLFRLAFNKRFFDIARHGASGTGADVPLGPVAYLIAKSHVSQLCMAALFLPLGVLVHASGTADDILLGTLYLLAVPLSFAYLGYRRPLASPDVRTLPVLPADPRARERG